MPPPPVNHPSSAEHPYSDKIPSWIAPSEKQQNHARTYDFWKARPFRDNQIALPGGEGTISSVFWPTEYNYVGATSPKAQFENIYGHRLAEDLRQKAIEWQKQNPKLQGSWTPQYEDAAWSRQIPVLNANVPEYNAMYARTPENEELFLQNNSEYDVLGVTPKRKPLPFGLDGSPTPLSDNALETLGGGSKRAPTSEDPVGRISHSRWSTLPITGVHEATHALQPGFRTFGFDPPKTPQSIKDLVYGKGDLGLLSRLKEKLLGQPSKSEYGLSELEFPSHISEMKARYKLDTGTDPYMDTPEQRLKFINHWRDSLVDPNMSDFHKERYTPIVDVLQQSSPAASENWLRGIVRNDTAAPTGKLASVRPYAHKIK